ncbi:hypothetical protein D3C86_2138510 [compost metagenome]
MSVKGILTDVLRPYGVVDHHFFPQMRILLNKFEMDRVRLVDFFLNDIFEKTHPGDRIIFDDH